MATPDDLKNALKDTLENRGVLNQIKARIRAEVFNALDDQSERKPPISNENILINELIREYLEFNKYSYASSVLASESGMSKVPLEREFLKNELNVKEEGGAKRVPLLYSLVAQCSNRNKDNSLSHIPQRSGTSVNSRWIAPPVQAPDGQY